MQKISIKKKEDLVAVLGLKVTDKVLEKIRKPFMKRLPFSIELTTTKPQFHLDDGGMLRAYAVDLISGEVVSEKYCGSGDSVINHAKEQLGEGQKAPGEIAVFFVETMPNGRNHSWFLTVVSNQVTPQLEELEKDYY